MASRSVLTWAVILLSLADASPSRAQHVKEPDVAVVLNKGDPRDWEAYFDIGVAKFKNFPKEAQAAFTWSSRLEPGRAEPLFAWWAAAFSQLDEVELVDYFRGDEKMMKRPDLILADSLLQRSFARNPFVHRGLLLQIFDRFPGVWGDDRDTRAIVAYSNGDFRRAIELYTRSIDQRARGGEWVRFDRASAYVAIGEFAAARDDLTELLRILREQDDRSRRLLPYQSKHYLLYMLGRLAMELRDYEGARKAFGDALVENAGFAYAHFGLGSASRALRQLERSAEEFGLGVELVPNDGFLRFHHAQVLMELQRFEGAGRELTRAIELEPVWAAPQLVFGRLRERQGRVADADAFYQRYVEMAPGSDAMARALKLRLDARSTRSP